ncbi:MAG: acetyl-CoA carboxylase biotin carboxyl carrier protein [Paracoccaceae bacterium]|jgi:acetyl-CoA carboxylase biotin carboxyl carrier protein
MSKKPQDADVAFVQALAELLRANDLTEIEVVRETDGDNTLNVRVARQIEAAPVVMAAPAPVAAAAPQASAAPVAAAPKSDDPAQHPGAVTSPMVGTVYLSAEPGAPVFVSVGDKVTEGQTVCIVEAMKTMNQIHAPRAGTVKRIVVEDSGPVEFGAPLMIIE